MQTPVTYLLMTYRQAKYVRDAVRSALAQDLQPLEIIISDDASGEGTFEAAADEARRYAGPHTVRLNRNGDRLGSAEHLAKLTAMARGRLLVTAHGDDISLPHRARTLLDAMQRHRVSLASSNATYIDAHDRPHGAVSRTTGSQRIEAAEMIANGRNLDLLGATLAFDRAVVERFRPLQRRNLATGLDQVLPLRASVLDGVYFVAESLVRYRRHADNMSNAVVDRTGTQLVFDESCLAQDMAARAHALADLEALNQIDPSEAVRDTCTLLERRLLSDLHKWAGLRAQLHASDSRPTWIAANVMAQRRLKRRFSTRWWQHDREFFIDKVRRHLTMRMRTRSDESQR